MDSFKDTRKSMLIVIPRMPYPLNSGGRIAIYETIKSLAKNYRLTLIIIDDDTTNVKYLHEMQKFSSDVTFYSKKKIWFIFNAICGLFTNLPLQVGYFRFNAVQKIVEQKVVDADVFFAFMIRTTSYGLNLKIKKIHYAIDSMYLNYKNSQQNTKSRLWKLIYKIEVPLLFRVEKKHIKEYDLTTFVNKKDSEFWKKYGNSATLPHGIENKYFHFNDYDARYNNVIMFIGRMDYQPNIDAVLWFCDNVLKHLVNGIEFWIIGGYPKPQVKSLELRYSNVKVLGFVDNPEILLRSSLCTVSPMQSGGGLQTKVLLAMALESLVISSSLPIAAIENAVNDVNILVVDEPYKFSQIINDIYQNPQKYTHIKHSARKVINTTYSIEVLEQKLFTLINKI